MKILFKHLFIQILKIIIFTMITTISKNVLYRNNPVYSFSLKQKIFDHLYLADKSTPQFNLVHSPMSIPPQNIRIQEVQPRKIQFTTSKLPNGITVLTQGTVVPSTVKLGFFLDIGTRDQTLESSGSLLSIKNTLFKTVLNTNETVNYGVHQMSGGQFQMNYDRESTYWRASCLAHDTIDVFSVLADCVLQPRSVVAANVAIHKNQYSHKLDAYLGGNQHFNDVIHQVAFGGYRGLGLPLKGLKKNISYLTAKVLQQFQLDNIAPQRIIVTGGGIDNHQQFADLVYDKLSTFSLASKARTREATVYQGGQIRNLHQSNIINVALIFQGATQKDSAALHIAHNILGQNRRNGRIQQNILNKHSYIQTSEPFIATFTDSGLFGIKLSGSAAHASEVVNTGVYQLRSLRSVTKEQVQSAKQLLKSNIFRRIQCRGNRLEDAARSQYNNGNADLDYGRLIDAITVKDVQAAVSKSLSSRLTLVLDGGEANKVQSYDRISSRFN